MRYRSRRRLGERGTCSPIPPVRWCIVSQLSRQLVDVVYFDVWPKQCYINDGSGACSDDDVEVSAYVRVWGRLGGPLGAKRDKPLGDGLLRVAPEGRAWRRIVEGVRFSGCRESLVRCAGAHECVQVVVHVDLASIRDHAGLQEGYAARRDVLCVILLQSDEVTRKIDGLAIPCRWWLGFRHAMRCAGG